MYRVERDTEFHSYLIEDLARWHHDYIVGDRPPPARAGDESWVSKRFPRAESGFIADNEEIYALARAKLKAATEKKIAEEAENSAKARLKQILGDAEGVKASWGKIYFRNSKERTVIDWEGLARMYAPDEDTVKKFTHTIPGPRSLRIYETKDDAE
jgi:hypothetical protein